MRLLKRLRRQVRKAKKKVERLQEARAGIDLAKYALDPVAYAYEVLKVKYLTPDQEDILRSLVIPPYRTLVRASHNVGKSYLAAIAACWFYDTHPESGTITTAPKFDSVKRIIWKEIRRLRRAAGLMSGLAPRAPEMRTSETHYARGATSSTGEGFSGDHDLCMMFVIDEAVGVEAMFWDIIVTMFKPEPGMALLAIFNPTNVGSEAYQQWQSVDRDGNPSWHQFTLSGLNHPNIKAYLEGDKPPVKAAISFEQLDTRVQEWCDPVPDCDADDKRDFLWPPPTPHLPQCCEVVRGRRCGFRAGHEGPHIASEWWRPGPIFQARHLGCWPSGVSSIWPEYLWQSVVKVFYPPGPEDLPEIGCDVAGKGDDYTSIHLRWGWSSYHHESHNGWDEPLIARRLMDLCDEWAKKISDERGSNHASVDPKLFAMKIDDDAYGGGVVAILQEKGYNAIGVSASSRSTNGKYPNKRSELWFQVKDRARAGCLGLKRLPADAKKRIWQQLSVTEWDLDAGDRRVVEPKVSIKKKLGRSPDDADAFNLAYMVGVTWEAPPVLEGAPAAPLAWKLPERSPRRGPGGFPFGR